MPSKQPQTPELADDCFQTVLSATSNQIYNTLCIIFILSMNE